MPKHLGGAASGDLGRLDRYDPMRGRLDGSKISQVARKLRTQCGLDSSMGSKSRLRDIDLIRADVGCLMR